MSSLKADFFLEEKVNLLKANSEPKSVLPPPRVLLTHYNVIILLAFILFTFLTFTNNAFSQPMKFLYDQIIQENNLSFITVTRTTNQITLKINYTNLNYTIDSTENGWYINMENFGGNGPQGHPDLPYRTYTLELPANVVFNSISTTIDSIYSSAAGNYSPFKPVAIYADTIVLDEQNEEIYNTNSNYPAKPISITNPSNMRNWVFLGFELYPFQYNPVTGNLTKIDSIEYVIDFNIDSNRDTTTLTVDSTKVPAYCIITTQEIVNNSLKLYSFCQSKREIGFNCFVVTVDSLDDCNFTDLQAPGERPERIRKYLKENYIEKNIEYVLLIGNPDPKDPIDTNDTFGDVPMKMTVPLNYIFRGVTKQVEGFEFYPTDYYYSDLTGNWDIDSDELFAECISPQNSLSPIPQIINDTSYSIRMTGFIINNVDSLKLKFMFNDGMRIWINDTLLNSSDTNNIYYWSNLNSWSNSKWGQVSETNFFSQDTIPIRIEYFQNNKDAWFYIDYGILYEGNICYFNLQPNWIYHNSNGNIEPGAYIEYFNNKNLEGNPTISKVNDTIYFDCSIGDYQYDNNNNINYGVDFFPEIIVGRISVYNNIYYLDSILDRSINYQFTNDIIWRKNELLCFSFDISDYNTPEIIKKHCNNNNYNTFRIYSNNIITEDTNNLIIEPNHLYRVDSTCHVWKTIPFGLVNWCSHGSSKHATGIIYSYPWVESKYSTTCLNRSYPSIVFQGSCSNAYPEDSLNLAYSILKHNSVASIAATRLAWQRYLIDSINVSSYYYVSHWNYWFSKLHINDNLAIGEIFSKLKSQKTAFDFCQWENILGFNLYGDPSLKLKSEIQTIPLNQGWNFVSSYLLPDRSSMNSELWGINNNLKVAKNKNNEYCKPDSINDIGIWNFQESYKIYMNSADTLYIAGKKVNPVFDPIPLNSGINWVSYLRNSVMAVDTSNALKSIKNYLFMVKNNSGLIYVPAYGINQIGNMFPSQGYEITVTVDCNLIYPQDSTSYNYKSGFNEETILSPIAKKLTPFVANTGNDCTLILDALNVPDGYEIGIINGDGVLIGAGAVQSQVCALTVWGKDILNNSEGAIKGEELFAFTLDTMNNRIQEIELTNIQDFITKEYKNTLTYEKGKIYVCEANTELTTNNENLYITNQPNPFNEQTEITYKIPEEGNVVVNVSSIHGEIVASYNQGNQEAGIYNILFDGYFLLGGVYVIDLIYDNQRVQSTMILIK